jgi:ABC-type amino acid transport substrate-binding protein
MSVIGTTTDGRAVRHRGARLRLVGFTLLAGLLVRTGPAAAQEPATTPPAAATGDARSAASPSAPQAAPLPAELKVGITPNYPPLAFERDGKIVGIEPDLAAALAKQTGTRFVLVSTPWDELPEALNSREVDVVMSGVSITERRKQTVAFTSPYLAIGQMAVVRSEDLARLGGAGALDQKGVRVGVQRLTTGARYARDELNRATLVEFGSVESGIEALREKRIDAFIHDAPTVWRLTGRFEDDSSRALAGLYRPLTDEKIAWAVRKADAGTIGAALDAGLAKLRADGTLEQIIDRWITVRKVAKGPAELAPAK